MHAGVGGITPSALPEVRVNAVELPPGDHHFIAIRRINGNRRLIGGVSEDVVAICIYVRLKAGKHAELGDHARRSLYRSGRSRWIIVFLERLSERRLANGRDLPRSGRKQRKRNQANQQAEWSAEFHKMEVVEALKC